MRCTRAQLPRVPTTGKRRRPRPETSPSITAVIIKRFTVHNDFFLIIAVESDACIELSDAGRVGRRTRSCQRGSARRRGGRSREAGAARKSPSGEAGATQTNRQTRRFLLIKCWLVLLRLCLVFGCRRPLLAAWLLLAPGSLALDDVWHTDLVCQGGDGKRAECIACYLLRRCAHDRAGTPRPAPASHAQGHDPSCTTQGLVMPRGRETSRMHCLLLCITRSGFLR